jgi:hypothetical protein
MPIFSLDNRPISRKNTSMDTIIHLDEQLFNRAREFAQAAGQTVDAYIAQQLKNSLDNQPPSSGEKTRLVQNCEMRLQPGVDISNSAELLDIMEKGLDVSQRH